MSMLLFLLVMASPAIVLLMYAGVHAVFTALLRFIGWI
jgi:hypothetical protein